MVNPLYIVSAFLLAAFFITLADKAHRTLSLSVMFSTILYAFAAGALRLFETYTNPNAAGTVYTAGFEAPLSIVLGFGFKEALLITFINLIGLLGAIQLFDKFLRGSIQPIMLYMLLLLAANGLVFTRDIFNSFVFLEILSISSFALIGLGADKNAYSSGFKYMLASGLASSFLLIGIIFAYRYTGTLNLDTWAAMNIPITGGYKTALFMIVLAVLIELKPYPANGWALDVYQSAHGNIGGLLSTVNAGALIFLLYKLLPILPNDLIYLIAVTGLVSFVFSNLTALRQKDAKRLLGYSSTAQTGLIVFILSGLSLYPLAPYTVFSIAIGFLITNFFAKTGLFWLSDIVNQSETRLWNKLPAHLGLKIAFTLCILALAGLPPFPAFFAKWKLVLTLVRLQGWYWLGALLLGSLFEAVYLLRWLGYAWQKTEAVQQDRRPALQISKALPVLMGAAIFMLISVRSVLLFGLSMEAFYPLLGFALIGLIDFVPVKIKGLFALILVGLWVNFKLWFQLPLTGQMFALMLVGGTAIQFISFMRYQGAKVGLFPLLVMLIIAMGNLLTASSKIEFFLAWEFMTMASYLLIMRGDKAKPAALAYILFSLAGAYLMMTGLAMVPAFTKGIPLYAQSGMMHIGLKALVLLGLGFLIKMGALGVHVWLPDAYAESEDEFTSILSSVLSKVGVFGLFLALLLAKDAILRMPTLMEILGWLGVLTAFFGALMAVFQEDVKKLLAYSSMSQLGYVIIGLSLMSHLGWVSALYLAFNHLFFKALIFTAIAAVIMRTGTRNMYEMGGLIKKMPIAFISVLMGIIAVSGVPPLSGFGSKWFIYTSLLEQGHYLKAGLAFFSSAIAFLYLYKLIHTVFLGQAKPDQYKVKEAPIWMIIPQGIFIMLIMGISMFPNLITKPLSLVVGQYIAKPDWINWNGYDIVLTSGMLHGNWNGNLVMMVTMGVFGLPLLWLLLVNAKTQKVKQLNIVFAAERPLRPGTTHFAYNMFAHYKKALGFLVEPKITAFWNDTAEWSHSLSATLARIYTGNGQTYLLHIILYTLVLFMFYGGH